MDMYKDGNDQFLWQRVKDFLDKYPIYIIDYRSKNSEQKKNENVILEFGYILSSQKNFILLVEDEIPTDIMGFSYVRPLTMRGGEKKRKCDIDNDLKDKLTKELKNIIGNNS